MPDLLIRDIPDDDLALLDRQARRLGLSREEYLRRHLHQTARRADTTVGVADLTRLTDLAAALTDPETMERAWS